MSAASGPVSAASGPVSATSGPVSATSGPGSPAAVPATGGITIEATEAELSAVTYDERGLVPVVVQEASSREVLMLAWMNEEALRRTLLSGRTWFWSRSRQEYWCKGETSGDRQWVREVRYDCDGDTLLVRVDQEGRGACHTGERTCFFRAFGERRVTGVAAS